MKSGSHQGRQTFMWGVSPDPAVWIFKKLILWIEFFQIPYAPDFFSMGTNILFVEQLFCDCETVWKVFVEFITIILTK